MNCCESEKHKHHPRSKEEINNLKTRLNKIIGQLHGIDKMIDDNRYCGDILNQISAATNALNQVGYIVLPTIGDIIDCRDTYEKVRVFSYF